MENSARSSANNGKKVNVSESKSQMQLSQLPNSAAIGDVSGNGQIKSKKMIENNQSVQASHSQKAEQIDLKGFKKFKVGMGLALVVAEQQLPIAGSGEQYLITKMYRLSCKINYRKESLITKKSGIAKKINFFKTQWNNFKMTTKIQNSI